MMGPQTIYAWDQTLSDSEGSESSEDEEEEVDMGEVFHHEDIAVGEFYNFEVVGVDFTGQTTPCVIRSVVKYPRGEGLYVVCFSKLEDIQNDQPDLRYTLQVRDGQTLTTTLGSAFAQGDEVVEPRKRRSHPIPLFLREAFADPHVAARCCMKKNTLETRASTYFRPDHANCNKKP